MIEFTNITDEPIQRYIIPIDKSSVIFRLRYHEVAAIWCVDIEYEGRKVCGKKLSLGVYHLAGSNFPFDLIIRDTSKMGIDPFKQDDFSSGRIVIYMFESKEIAAIRGYDVP